MEQPTVISVNPGEKTLGAISMEGRSYDDLDARIAATVSATPESKELINFLTGIDTGKISSLSSKLLVLRVISAIGIGYGAYQEYLASGFGSILLLLTLGMVGLSLLFGFGTRLISTIGFIIIATLGFKEVIPAMPAVIYAIPAFLFMIMGPGIYSSDQLIRKAIFKATKRAKETRTSFSYKAYSTL